jgi:hexosaminidase
MSKLVFLILAVMFFSCTQPTTSEVMIIPQVQQTEQLKGFFKLKPTTAIVYSWELLNEANLLFNYLDRKTKLQLDQKTDLQSKNAIVLKIDTTISNNEGYKLHIDNKTVQITGKTPAGVFYGIQSLMQLVPQRLNGNYLIPAVQISDEPRFEYRGMHLDVCRHFFDINFVKKMLDAMALHKLNRFHWHLTDDQGWRIAIDKYPELTQIGAWRNSTLIGHASDRPERFDSIRYGGFYTKDEISEVIAYAEKLHITVIPEIELPGHSQAAVATYPYLDCFDQQLEVWNKWGISEGAFCAGKESTFDFFENVLSEVAALFPGEYIHIGGDECLKNNWQKCPHCQARMKAENLANEHELQSYFIQRIEKFLNSKGKKIIGWDEILEGGLAENATVMSWRGEQGGIAAAKMHHNVIMTPNPICYFDHYQGDKKNEPLAIGGLTTVDEVYEYNPVPSELADNEQKYIIGVQSNLWTEYIPTTAHAEYMLFPRLCALSEIAWTFNENKNYENFMQRLVNHKNTLELYELNYKPYN